MQMKHVTLTWSRVDWSMLRGAWRGKRSAQDGHARASANPDRPHLYAIASLSHSRFITDRG
jgi:hypothetical protein